MQILAGLSMLLQVLAFLMLLSSVRFRSNMKEHARAASLAVYTIIPSILFMFYSIASGFEIASVEILGLHRTLGLVTIAFIILFLTNQWKFKKKAHMDVAMGMWTLTFLLGAVVYYMGYLS